MLDLKIFYLKNKPIIAIPVNCSWKLSFMAVSCFPSFTLKKKIYKIYLYLYVLLTSLFIKKDNDDINNPELEIFLTFYQDFIKRETNKNIFPVFLWSTVDGRQRYYVHFLDLNGEKKYFAKLTTNKDDYSLIEAEYNNLLLLEKRKKSEELLFTTPKVINFENNYKYCSLIVESMKKDYKLFHPEKNPIPLKLIRNIQGEIHKKNLEDVKSFEWWLNSKLFDEVSILRKYIMSLSQDTYVDITFGHGDFGGENIFQNNKEKFIVIDWERSTTNAPVLLDLISYWLGKNHKELKNNQTEVIDEFYNYFKSYSQKDVALALIFLASVNFDLSFIISKKWKYYMQKENS